MTKLLDFRVSGDPGASVLSISPPTKKKAKPAEPLKPIDQWYPNVLAFDQSLASAGWAWLVKGQPTHTGMVTTTPLLEPGFEDSFQRGVQLARGFISVISEHMDLTRKIFSSSPLLLVHEMPVKPNPRMKSRNQEAGIVAAMAVRFAAAQFPIEVFMLNAQAVRKVLCDNAKATKMDVRGAVKKLVNVSTDLAYLNEHTYDAMALGIVGAERKGQGA